MPTVTPTSVKAYAHCTDAHCSGYHQEEVPAIREETAWTIGERGGDGAFAMLGENTSGDYRFENLDDMPCPQCSKPRNVTGEPRKQYHPLSGHDPMGLLNSMKFDAGKQVSPQNEELSTAQAEIAELKSQMRELLDALKEDDA